MACLSMTGFGTSRSTQGRAEIVVEIRSVNHRFLDTNFRLPQIYSAFEQPLNKILRESLRRGRVDVSVNRVTQSSTQGECRLNPEFFQAYLQQYLQAFSLAKCKSADSLSDIVLSILQRREVLEFVSPDSEVVSEQATLEKVFRAALVQLQEMRATEGQALETELLALLSGFEGICRQIGDESPATAELLRNRLMLRLEKLLQGVSVDPQAVAQEVALIAERVDVTEELARLQSHIAQFRGMLKSAEVGRKLDFLIQEMGREINTVGSKAQNSNISTLIVEAKAALEKIREQVQNVE